VLMHAGVADVLRGWDLHPRPHIHREGFVRRDDERVALQLGDLVVSLHQQLDAGAAIA